MQTVGYLVSCTVTKNLVASLIAFLCPREGKVGPTSLRFWALLSSDPLMAAGQWLESCRLPTPVYFVPFPLDEPPSLPFFYTLLWIPAVAPALSWSVPQMKWQAKLVCSPHCWGSVNLTSWSVVYILPSNFPPGNIGVSTESSRANSLLVTDDSN